MKNNVGRFVIIAFYSLLGLLAILSIVFMFPEHQYELHGEIYKVDYTENITLIATDDGNMWGWQGYEVPVKGTRMILTMTDTGTPDFIYDDAIVNMRRE